MKPEIGITLPTISDPETLERSGGISAAARHVEELGFESAWVPDVIVGDGTPAFEATVAVAAASSVTERIRLGFSVLVLPQRPVAWTAAQIQALQHVSGGRIILGVGSGGFPGAPFWRAVGGPSKGLGRIMDSALDVLPGLIAGEPTRLDDGDDEVSLTLSPAATVPPILIGGNSDAALRRTARYGDGWFPSLVAPDALASRTATLRELAEEFGHPTPGITVGGHAIPGVGEAARSARDALAASLTGDHGMTSEEAMTVPVSGGPEEISERLAAYADAGAERIVLSIDGEDWMCGCEILAEAHALM